MKSHARAIWGQLSSATLAAPGQSHSTSRRPSIRARRRSISLTKVTIFQILIAWIMSDVSSSPALRGGVSKKGLASVKANVKALQH